MTAQTILPANTLSSGYDVANSVRLDGSSAYMGKTMGTPTNIDKYTFSFWVKRSKLGAQQSIFRSTDDGTNDSHVTFQSDDTLRFEEYGGSASIGKLQTSQKFRDTLSWYHIVLVYDSGNGTAGNRMRMYVNGSEVTAFGTDNNPSQNADSFFNKDGEALHFGRTSYGGGANYFGGYVAEVVMCDGQAYAASDFGEFDSDSPTLWKPKDVSGLTFGNNGFYLDFEDSSNLGNDANGGTDFGETNLAATDQSTDTCTNNFATFNSLVKGAVSPTFKEGNIQVDAGNNWGHAVGTIGLASGKWYWEMDNITAQSNAFYGICNEFNVSHLDTDSTPYDQAGLILYFQDGRRTIDGTNSEGEYAAWSTTMACALDLDSGTRTVKFYRDNSAIATVNLTANFPAGGFVFPIWLGSASSNANGVDFNFGGTIATALASAESDANGYGNFEFAPPSGYYAICTKNLAEYG